MPVYEYECQACHRAFEYQQRMSDPEKTVCEACGGALERLISRTAFQLKGSGWYKDLYSSAKPADAKAGDGDAKAGDTKTGDAKTETKADTAAAAAPSSGGGGTGGGSSGTGTGTGSGS